MNNGSACNGMCRSNFIGTLRHSSSRPTRSPSENEISEGLLYPTIFDTVFIVDKTHVAVFALIPGHPWEETNLITWTARLMCGEMISYTQQLTERSSCKRKLPSMEDDPRNPTPTHWLKHDRDSSLRHVSRLLEGNGSGFSGIVDLPTDAL